MNCCSAANRLGVLWAAEGSRVTPTTRCSYVTPSRADCKSGTRKHTYTSREPLTRVTLFSGRSLENVPLTWEDVQCHDFERDCSKNSANFFRNNFKNGGD